MADAWSYADWITYAESTAAEVTAKLTRLRLHMQEVSQAVTADVSAGSKSRSTGSLNEYLRDLRADEKRLMTRAGPRASYPRRG